MSENRLERPVVSTTSSKALHRALIWPMREESSPAEYPLKNPAGRESTRIMTAACTWICTLVPSRLISSVLATEIKVWESRTLTINAKIASSSRVLLL